MTTSEPRRPDSGQAGLFIEFSGVCLVVETSVPAVRTAVRALFRPMLRAEPPAHVVERLHVTEVDGQYGVRRSRRAHHLHPLPQRAPDLDGLLRLLACYAVDVFVGEFPDRLWLQAGAVAGAGEAVLVVGGRKTGRSALVTALCEAGWTCLAAETVPIRPTGRVVDPFPLAVPARPSQGAPSCVVPSPGFPAGVPVGAVVFPREDPGATDAQAERVSWDEAALPLLYGLVNLDDHGGGALPPLKDLVERGLVVEVRYADARQAADLIGSLMAGTAAALPPSGGGNGGPGRRATVASATPPVSRREPPPADWAPWAWEAGGRKLTVGMAVYDDYDGAYFTLQALRLYHPEVAGEVEFLIIDNNPDGPCGEALRKLAGHASRCRYVPNRTWRSAASKDLVFREARTPYVLCVDAHVMVAPGALRRLIDYFDAHPDTLDLLQGPLLNDDFLPSTHWEPGWTHGMYGVWDTDVRGLDPEAPPFEVPMQGCGLFASRREAWPGFNPRFTSHGGEEGYLHEKVRQRGGRTLCLPFLRWMHRFDAPLGVRYPFRWGDRIRNYTLGFRELGLEGDSVTGPFRDHFRQLMGEAAAEREFASAEAYAAHPLSAFDAVYGVAFGEAQWEAMRSRLEALGFAHGVRRFPTAGLPADPRTARALAHRGVVGEARRHGLRHVLVLDHPAALPVDGAPLTRAIGDLMGRDWSVRLLDGPSGERAAVAYHHSAYDRLLADLPPDEDGMRVWCGHHPDLDRYLSHVALPGAEAPPAVPKGVGPPAV